MIGVTMINRLHRNRDWKSFMWMLAGFTGSFIFLALAMKDLPMGTAYAVSTGIGAAGGAIAGSVLRRAQTFFPHFLHYPRTGSRRGAEAGFVGWEVCLKNTCPDCLFRLALNIEYEIYDSGGEAHHFTLFAWFALATRVIKQAGIQMLSRKLQTAVFAAILSSFWMAVVFPLNTEGMGMKGRPFSIPEKGGFFRKSRFHNNDRPEEWR